MTLGWRTHDRLGERLSAFLCSASSGAGAGRWGCRTFSPALFQRRPRGITRSGDAYCTAAQRGDSHGGLVGSHERGARRCAAAASTVVIFFQKMTLAGAFTKGWGGSLGFLCSASMGAGAGRWGRRAFLPALFQRRPRGITRSGDAYFSDRQHHGCATGGRRVARRIA